MKNILFVSYHFPPIGGVGVQRTLKYIKYLPYFGWKPFVLTQKGAKWKTDESELLSYLPANAEILRVKPWVHIWEFFPAASSFWGKIRNTFTKVLNYISIPDRAIFWCLPSIRKAVRLIKNKNIEVIYTTSPPNSTHLLGYLLSQITKRPWIADFRDPWVEDPLIDRNKFSSRIRLKIQTPMEARVIASTQRITVTTEQTREGFIKKYGSLVSQKISVIPNGYDPEDFAGLEPLGHNNKFRITYTGSLRSLRTCIPFLQALQELLKEKPELRKEISVTFFGQQKSQEAVFVKKAGLSDIVKFHGYVSHKESLQHQISSDVLLLFMTVPSSKGGGQILPAKIFEYIASGKPILGILPPEGEAGKLIQNENLGIAVDFEDISKIKEAIYKLYQQYKNDALKVSISPRLLRTYNRKELTLKLAHLMDQLVKSQN